MRDCIVESDPAMTLEPLASDLAAQGELCDALAGFPLLDNLSPAELRLAVPYLLAYRASAGTVIAEEGSPDNRLGILLEGRATLYRTDGTGARQQLKTITAGMWFGESSWVDGSPAWTTAIVDADAKLVLLSREDFFRMAGKHAIIGVRLIHKICRLLSLQLSEVSGQCVEYHE